MSRQEFYIEIPHSPPTPNLVVMLKIGKEKADISQGVGVIRQGDNLLSPVIFLLIMAAFSIPSPYSMFIYLYSVPLFV
jgi:hypothetical protein